MAAAGTALIVGASRGLGLALVEEFLARGWRFVEAFQDLVPATGTIGVTSSRQGSVSLNTRGGQELYRASKSALNQLMRGFAARYHDDPRTLLLINPGHVRTELGGPDAPLTVEQSIPGVVDTITAHAGEPGLQFLDRRNETVPW